MALRATGAARELRSIAKFKLTGGMAEVQVNSLGNTSRNILDELEHLSSLAFSFDSSLNLSPGMLLFLALWTQTSLSFGCRVSTLQHLDYNSLSRGSSIFLTRVQWCSTLLAAHPMKQSFHSRPQFNAPTLESSAVGSRTTAPAPPGAPAPLRITSTGYPHPRDNTTGFHPPSALLVHICPKFPQPLVVATCLP
ncbi:hypothetical protein Tco_0359684 [Tanacetum coccineum]